MRRKETFLYDSREQHPFIFKGHTNLKTCLKVGDNSIRGYGKFIAIERKGWSDFVRCLTCDWDRFFERDTSQVSKLMKLEHACIVVEGTCNRGLSHTYTRIPLTVEFLARRIAKISLRVPVILMDTRPLAREVALRFLLEAKDIFDGQV